MIRPFSESDFLGEYGFKYRETIDIVYPENYWESNECFRQKIKAFPQGALALDISGLVGYAFSHPWKKDQIVPLNCLDFSLPSTTDCYYIHDIAIIVSERGKGYGKLLMDYTLEVGRKAGFRDFKLVSVMSSHPVWMKHGFKIVEEITYGGDKAYVMIK